MVSVPSELIYETISEIVERFLKPKFIELGMNSSGNWLKSLGVRSANNEGEIMGPAYTEQLALGRKPGKRPPSDALIGWVNSKFGIYGKEAETAAFLIARKIGERGTDYYPNGTDLLKILNSSEVIAFIDDKIGSYLIEAAQKQMLEDITKIFR